MKGPRLEIFEGTMRFRANGRGKWRDIPSGQFYWRFRAANNRIIAIGAEPFASPANAKRAFLTMRLRKAQFEFYGVEKIKVKR